MSTDGEWGTERELKALAHAPNIPVVVIPSYEGHEPINFEPKKSEIEPIYLGFDGETTGQEHYYSLEPGKK